MAQRDALREVLTVVEAAELLSLSPYTVREMARRGEIPAKKVGKEWRFLRQALLDWIRPHESKTSEPRAPKTPRVLRITPARRPSGKHDISSEHDRYFAAG
jgi:excisionase family DNA binding protein